MPALPSRRFSGTRSAAFVHGGGDDGEGDGGGDGDAEGGGGEAGGDGDGDGAGSPYGTFGETVLWP